MTRKLRQLKTISKVCAYCGQPFTAESPRARWCSSACKQAVYRERKEKRRP